MIVNDGVSLREGVKRAYSQAAENPAGEHAFPVGRDFAESLGYDPDILDGLPSVAVEGFAGVSNIATFAEIHQGSVVLDLGCGAGLDTLIVAGLVGDDGKVISLDFSEAMLMRARQAVDEAQCSNVELRCADAEELPIEDSSIDITIVNGIFNLNPQREAIFHELARVMKPGGIVYSAEMILRQPLSDDFEHSEDNWFA